jgi:hypothetical protein
MITNAGVALRSWMVRRTTTDAFRDVVRATVPSADGPFRVFSRSDPTEQDACSFDMEVEEVRVQAYNEEAFRYFLEIERKRSEGSSRPLLLLLVDVKGERGGDGVIDAATAAQLFGGLSACLRETDFVGWYREPRVVGAVLTQQHTSSQRTDMLSEISDRVLRRLSGYAPSTLVGRIQLRVFHLPVRPEDEQ